MSRSMPSAHKIEYCRTRASEMYHARDARPAVGGKSVIYQGVSWIMTEDLYDLIYAHDVVADNLRSLCQYLFGGESMS